ncbi:unnamed protein product [Penicillium bialowiezense]
MVVATYFPKKPDDLLQPPQPLPLYEFIHLADPPAHWTFLGVMFERVEESRILKVTQLQVLAKHYFWGMHWAENTQTAKTIRKAHNQATLTRALWKLFWYMQEEHKPKDYTDLLNLDRDTGPRLLRYDINPRPPPLSRWFPVQPDDRTLLLPAYVRPLNPPLDLPDLMLQQYMYSADSFHEPSITPELPQEPFGDESQFSNFTFEADLFLQATQKEIDLARDNELMQYLRHEQGDSLIAWGQDNTSPQKRKRSLSPGAPNYRGVVSPPTFTTRAFQTPVFASRRRPSEWTWQPGLHPEHVSPPPEEPQVGPLVQMKEPVYEHQIVAEAIEKALMQVVYADLDRDPSAPSRTEPMKNITAHCFKDMLQMKIGAFSTISHVRVSPITLKWDPRGTSLPLRGRGPVWNADSCATDCVIMVGRLLDVGCTRVDRTNNRSAEFTDMEKSYIEVTNIPWEILDEKASIRARDEFLQKFIDGQLHLRMGKPLPPWAVWSQVTKSVSQFRYHHIERVTPCRCENADPFINYHEGSCILPGYRKGDNKGVAVGTLIERCFYDRKSFGCKRCGDPHGITGERRMGQLPLRLVMTFDGKTRLRNHTQNMTFKYTDYDDKRRVAHYRWLGGIYNNEEHARVYWTDSNRGEQTGTNVMIYDSQINKGLLLGAVPAFRADDRVPNEWVNYRAIPLLFYERILDPTTELLASAHTAVSDMANILQSNKNVLEAHVAWVPPSTEPPFDPWERVLSDVGERFTNYNPNWTRATARSDSDSGISVGTVSPDPALIDPSVIDQSLLDPSLYSNTVPPLFDISSILDPPTPEEMLAQQIPQGGMQDRLKNHLFQSMLDTPDWLSSYEALWPSGKPSKDGALEFPDFPTWPSPRGRKRRRVQSDTSMPDAYDQQPETDGGEHKAVVMLNRNIDPRQKEANAKIREEEELHTFLKKVEVKWRTERKKNAGGQAAAIARMRPATTANRASNPPQAAGTATRIPPAGAKPATTEQQRSNVYNQSKAIQNERAEPEKSKRETIASRKAIAAKEAEVRRQAKTDQRKADREASQPQASSTGGMKPTAEAEDEDEDGDDDGDDDENENEDEDEDEDEDKGKGRRRRRGRAKRRRRNRAKGKSKGKGKKGKGKAKDDDPTWTPNDESDSSGDLELEWD